MVAKEVETHAPPVRPADRRRDERVAGLFAQIKHHCVNSSGGRRERQRRYRYEFMGPIVACFQQKQAHVTSLRRILLRTTTYKGGLLLQIVLGAVTIGGADCLQKEENQSNQNHDQQQNTVLSAVRRISVYRKVGTKERAEGTR